MSLSRPARDAAASKVGSSLVAREPVREVHSKPGMPVWREDEDNRSIGLVITRAGRAAIGVEDEATDKAAQPAKEGAGSKRSSAKRTQSNASSNAPRAGSKQVLVIEMLSAKKGATLDALIEATGWLPHTTRAALTGLRKRGFSIERARDG